MRSTKRWEGKQKGEGAWKATDLFCLWIYPTSEPTLHCLVFSLLRGLWGEQSVLCFFTPLWLPSHFFLQIPDSDSDKILSPISSLPKLKWPYRLHTLPDASASCLSLLFISNLTLQKRQVKKPGHYDTQKPPLWHFQLLKPSNGKEWDC